MCAEQSRGVSLNRRTILIDFYWMRDKDPRIPLGHASILTALRSQVGLDVRSIVVAVNSGCRNAEDIARAVLEETTNLAPSQVDIAFGAYVWGEDLLQDVLRRIRHLGFRGRIIVGGPQISYSGPGLERIYPDADAFIRGYGEEALAALTTTAEMKPRLPGVHWAGTPDLQTQAMVNLETLPSPWLTRTIPLEGQSFIRWETQRGCPFRCAFCQHREPGSRLRHRALGLSRIRSEIDLFCESKVDDIAVLDPIFNMAPHAVEVLQHFAERDFTGRLSLQCRAEAITAAFVEAAAALNVCLEFGLQTIHAEEARAIRRNNQLQLVDDVLAQVRAFGLRHEVSLIFGLPHQSLASFEASVAWCLTREVPVIKAFPLLLLRGTALERDRGKWGLEDSGGAMPVVLRSNSFNVLDWQVMAQISEALRLTEGRHPRYLSELKQLAATLEPDMFRWIPAGTETVTSQS